MYSYLIFSEVIHESTDAKTHISLRDNPIIRASAQTTTAVYAQSDSFLAGHS